MQRGCLTCWAYFNRETDKETLRVLNLHLKECSEEKPFTDDENADGYEVY